MCFRGIEGGQGGSVVVVLDLGPPQEVLKAGGQKRTMLVDKSELVDKSDGLVEQLSSLDVAPGSLDVAPGHSPIEHIGQLGSQLHRSLGHERVGGTPRADDCQGRAVRRDGLVVGEHRNGVVAGDFEVIDRPASLPGCGVVVA